jgi:deoxyribose-phosphate aldolase
VDVFTHQLAGMIDHAVLSPTATRDDVARGCEVAVRWSVASVCVRPCDVAPAAKLLNGTGVATGTVIGFPLGTTTTAAKIAETKEAMADGADELDMVLNIGRLAEDDMATVIDDIAAVVSVATGRCVKVILECAYLSDEQIVIACQAVQSAGAHFVKTSTGFGPHGATVEHVKLMRQTVGPVMGVKASGGIKTLDDALVMVKAGANRIGTSSTEKILAELEA